MTHATAIMPANAPRAVKKLDITVPAAVTPKPMERLGTDGFPIVIAKFCTVDDFLLVEEALVGSLGKRGLHETLRTAPQAGQNPPPNVLISHLNNHSLINSLEVKIYESTGLHADASSALPYEISPVLSESLCAFLIADRLPASC